MPKSLTQSLLSSRRGPENLSDALGPRDVYVPEEEDEEDVGRPKERDAAEGAVEENWAIWGGDDRHAGQCDWRGPDSRALRDLRTRIVEL